VFFSLQEAARRISDYGRIINISSGQTIHPAVNFALYSGSKVAAKLFVQVLAQEIGFRGVTVNNIVAGPVDIGFLENAEADYKNMMAQANALKRLAKADDIADVVAILVRDEARFITGQDIIVDGGATHF
jgi:3-oxoacyl-[acyl-carrier protein] reductase